MNTCENFRLEIYTDGDHEMVVIKADLPHSTGLNYIWFVLTKHEFVQLCSGKRSTFEDGYHKLSSFGDLFLFYDMENWPKDNNGTMNVRYVNLTIPRKVQIFMLKRANNIWDARKIDKSPERTTVEFNKVLCDRLIRQFGTGKGKSKLEFRNDEYLPVSTKNLFESFLGNPSFERNINNLLTIAKNQTQSYNEMAQVFLAKDGEGFTFDVMTPQHQSIMYGGLINHGTEEKPDWSIHT